jgi:hypothetical protein
LRCIKCVKVQKVICAVKEHKAAHQQKDSVGGSIFRRWMVREAGVMDMLGSPVVSVEETHHVEAGPNHEGHKHKISKQYEKHKFP